MNIPNLPQNEFRDPIIFQKRTSAEPKTDLNKKIINNRIVLDEIPKFDNHVTIANYFEVFDKDATLASNQFYCNYTLGILIFATTEESKVIPSIAYYATGAILTPASRIYYESIDFKTLQDLVDDTLSANSTFTTAENLRISRENTRVSNENTRQTNETNRTNSFNTMVNNTSIIWKAPVANFAAIATTYPSPASGWGVQTLNDGKVYRYNGSTWVYTFLGNVVPTVNYLWIEEKTINAGSNSLTLVNLVGINNKLTIIDKTYGVEWIEGIHWNRTNQIISLTETSLLETLTFRIINWG